MRNLQPAAQKPLWQQTRTIHGGRNADIIRKYLSGLEKGEIFSAIFMDVVGAFNNVHHERLIHNMRKHRIPTEITQWILSFLSKRTTKMKFNGITTDHIPTPTGIPQGSPLSPILYILYNSDLLD